MPYRIERPCKNHQCPNTTSNSNGYCDECKADEHRGNANERGYDAKWEKFRKRFLRENPLCEDCLKERTLTPATDVHHIIKLRDAPERKFDKNNLMALCHKCHSARTKRGE